MSAGSITRIRRSLRGCRLKPSMRLCLFEEEFCLDLFGFLIALPILDRWVREPHECMESWGVYWESHGHSLVFCWRDRTKFIHMPWRLEIYKREVMKADGTWTRQIQSYEKDCPPDGDGRLIQSFEYRYELKSGEIQYPIAKVHVERYEWRRKWHMSLPLFNKVRKSIDVEFDREVGESSGSWKGGCIGCGYDMLPHESAEMTLRRMERERVFR